MMKCNDDRDDESQPGRVLESLQLWSLLSERFLPYILAQSKNSGSNLLMKVHHQL